MPHNVIKKVPGGIGHLSKLRKLDLKGNDIAKIPRTVGKLKELNEVGTALLNTPSQNILKISSLGDDF